MSETIADIVREMRGMLCKNDKDTLDIPPKDDIFHIESLKCEFIQRYADRIEAAAKRENEREADCTNCDYANVVADNERLRAAQNAHNKKLESLRAVREAQSIYKEGEAK